MTKTDIIANLPAFCLLSIHEKFMSGDPITEAERATADRIALAAAFGAEAFIHHSGCEGGATNAMLIAFLTALTDPTSPDLDYLRRDPDAAKAARAKASQEIRGASGGSGIVVTKKATPNPEGPHRIWLDLRSFNGAVGFAHTEGQPKDGWAGYIRAYPAASSEYVISGDGTGTALPSISEQEISADRSAPAEVEGLVDYDAGLLNDWGGGNTDWWLDYLRAEIGRANEFWRDQTAPALTAQQAEIERLRLMERDTYATWKKVAGDLQARAEKAEAERNAWKANAEQLRKTGMICINSFVTGIKEGNERKHWNCAVDSHDHLSAAHAKLKGDV